MDRATYYHSDVHLGTNDGMMELFARTSSALPEFLEEQNLHVTRVASLGDVVETWLPGKGFEDGYKNPDVIKAMRAFYSAVFRDRRPDVIACPGNHEIGIIEDEITSEEAMARDQEATVALDKFLREAVFEGQSEMKIETFSSFAETDPNVFAHHGHRLNSPKAVRKALSKVNFSDDLSQKLSQLAANEGMHLADQRFFNFLKKHLWPLYEHLPIQVINFVFYLIASSIRFKALAKEITTQSRRSIQEMWNGPLTNDALLQFEILNCLSPDPEHGAIVSGHSHIPGMVSKKKGTVVGLGSFDNGGYNPVVGIHREHGPDRIFHLASYDRIASGWQLRDTVSL